MQEITSDLFCSPREIRVKGETWWEVGNDGIPYATTAGGEVYKQIMRSKNEKGLVIVRSVRYSFVKE